MANGKISNEEKTKLINEIYSDFLNKVKNIEIERDQKIMEIIKEIDQRKIQKILSDLKNFK